MTIAAKMRGTSPAGQQASAVPASDRMDEATVEGGALYSRLFQVALSLVVLGALAGKANLSRLGDFVGAAGNLEVRAVTLTIALAVLIAAIIGGGRELLTRQIPAALAVGLPWIVLAAYHWWAGGYLWAHHDAVTMLSDLAYFAAIVSMAALATRGQKDLMVVALIMEGFAAALLVASALSLGPKTYAYNYGEIGTTITNYRIYGIGLCSGLYMLMRPGPIWARALHLAVTCLFVFACLGSTSRTSVVAIVAVSGTLLITASVAGRWKQLLVVATIGAVGVSALVVGGYSAGLTGRLAQVSGGASIDGGPAAFDGLDVNVQAQIEALTAAMACAPSIATEVGREVTVRADSCQGSVILADPTHRIRMALNAIEIFSANLLWGGGSSAYNLLINDPNSQPYLYGYPHNIYLEMAAGSGVFGLALLGFSLLTMIIIFGRAIALEYENVYLFCIPILYLAGSLTGGDTYDARMAWVVTAMVAGAYAGRLRRRSAFAEVGK